jgi:hypothetical protein
MIFHPSNSISNIRLNVFVFHSLAVIIIGISLLLVSISSNSFGSVGENQVYGLIAILLGAFSLYFTIKKKEFIVLANLLILAAVLVFDLFLVAESYKVNIIVISAFIAFLPLVNIFYGIRVGLYVLAALITLIAVRYYLIIADLLEVQIVSNSGWFDVTIFAIFIIYSVIIFGYYSTTIRRFISENEQKEGELKKQVLEYQDKKTSITSLLNEVDNLLTDYDSDIKKTLLKAQFILKKNDNTDFVLLQSVGDEISNDLDFILKTINEKIEKIEEKKNDK